MIRVNPVKLDIAVDQGMDLSSVVWTFRSANGMPVDLSNTVATCTVMDTYPIWQGVTLQSYVFDAEANANGDLMLSSNSAYMANVHAGVFVYAVSLKDPSDNTSVQVMSGILTVNPFISPSSPPAANGTMVNNGNSAQPNANAQYAS